MKSHDFISATGTAAMMQLAAAPASRLMLKGIIASMPLEERIGASIVSSIVVTTLKKACSSRISRVNRAAHETNFGLDREKYISTEDRAFHDKEVTLPTGSSTWNRNRKTFAFHHIELNSRLQKPW